MLPSVKSQGESIKHSKDKLYTITAPDFPKLDTNSTPMMLNNLNTALHLNEKDIAAPSLSHKTKCTRFKIEWRGVDLENAGVQIKKREKPKIKLTSKQKKTTKTTVNTRKAKAEDPDTGCAREIPEVQIFRTPPSRKPNLRSMQQIRKVVIKDSKQKDAKPPELVVITSEEFQKPDWSSSFFDHSFEDPSVIVSSIQSNDSIDAIGPATKRKVLYDLIPELKFKPSGTRLLMEYAKAKVEGKLDSLTPNNYINEFLFHAIHKDGVLKSIFSKESAYPSDIKSLVFKNKDSDMGDLMQTMSGDAFNSSDKEWDLFFFTTLRSKFSDVLQEISCSLPEFEYFYRDLFLVYIASTSSDDSIINETNQTNIRKIVTDFKTFLSEGENFEAIRSRVGEIIRTAEVNHVLRSELAYHAPEWLGYLCQNLATKLKSDRDCICCSIVIVITSNEFCWDLLNNRYVDIGYDLVKCLIRVIGVCGDSFAVYYSTIGFVLHCCHVISILDCIIEAAPTVTHHRWVRTWPFLITCALRHWDSKHFKGYNTFQRKLADQLKEAASNPRSKKSAKVALHTLSQKLLIDVELVTTAMF